MDILWGIVVATLSLLAWGGQTIVLFSPEAGVRFGLSEAEHDVEAAFWADIRGEAFWDFLTLWTMVSAGVLLIAHNPLWPYFGLVGGGSYVYFSGRGIATRVSMKQRDLRIGSPQSLRLSFTLLTIWGVMALITIAAAVIALPTP